MKSVQTLLAARRCRPSVEELETRQVLAVVYPPAVPTAAEQLFLERLNARVVGLFADKFPSPSSGASTTSITFFRIQPSALQFIDNGGARTSFSDEEFGMDFHRQEVLSDSSAAAPA